VDPGQIERVIVNVLINAMDALPDGGDIFFATSVLENTDGDGSPQIVRIEIKDNGIGIPEKHFQSIFDPFFSTKESGTGIGLPLSLGIIENHLGKMSVLPRNSKGIKVIIDLPIHSGSTKEETPTW
jgi:two-component system, NtrC family, sensor kinase